MTILCTIDLLTREVFLPADQRIAAYDHNVDVIRFQAEPIEDFSLNTSTIKIAAKGPNKARHDYPVDPSTVSIEEETGYITFDWPIPQGVTEMPEDMFGYGSTGQLIFAVCAEIISGSTVSKAWHSDDGIITVVAHLEPEAGGGEDPEEEATNAQKIAQLQTNVAVMGTQIGALGNGSPTPVATVAEMTDESAVYLYTGSETGYNTGNWYYYNGTAWISGGTYGGAVTDTTLTIEGVAADAKAVGDALSNITIEVDDTLTEQGKAADAKAVGDALAEKADTADTEAEITALDDRVTAIESGSDTEKHEYTYVIPSLTRCNWDWANNSGGSLCKTEVKAMPQYIILNKAVSCNANGGKMCASTEDFATPLDCPLAHLFKMTYPVNEMVETHMYGEDEYKYFRMMLPYSADLEVTFVYDTWRPSNDASVLNTDIGSADVETKIGFAYPENTARLRGLAVVPFYPDKTYYFRRNSFHDTLMSYSTNVFGVYTDDILGDVIPSVTIGATSYGTPYHYTYKVGNATSIGNNRYSFDGASAANSYPKYLAFEIWQTSNTTTDRATALSRMSEDTRVSGWDVSLFGKAYTKGNLRMVDVMDTPLSNPFTSNPLMGADVVVFGDSLLDQYGGRSYDGSLPLSKIAKEFFLDLDNRAKSGTHICTGGSVDDSTHNGVYMLDTLISEVDAETREAPDYILFEYGSNGGTSVIGNIDDTSSNTGTTVGAMKYCIEKCREKLPNTCIGFVLPPQSTWNGNYGRNVSATREIMLQVLALDDYAVPYCDMWKESGITKSMLPDNIHISTAQSQNLYYHALRRFLMTL